jgi:hypothetical protein
MMGYRSRVVSIRVEDITRDEGKPTPGGWAAVTVSVSNTWWYRPRAESLPGYMQKGLVVLHDKRNRQWRIYHPGTGQFLDCGINAPAMTYQSARLLADMLIRERNWNHVHARQLAEPELRKFVQAIVKLSDCKGESLASWTHDNAAIGKQSKGMPRHWGGPRQDGGRS